MARKQITYQCREERKFNIIFMDARQKNSENVLVPNRQLPHLAARQKVNHEAFDCALNSYSERQSYMLRRLITLFNQQTSPIPAPTPTLYDADKDLATGTKEPLRNDAPLRNAWHGSPITRAEVVRDRSLRAKSYIKRFDHIDVRKIEPILHIGKLTCGELWALYAQDHYRLTLQKPTEWEKEWGQHRCQNFADIDVDWHYDGAYEQFTTGYAEYHEYKHLLETFRDMIPYIQQLCPTFPIMSDSDITRIAQIIDAEATAIVRSRLDDAEDEPVWVRHLLAKKTTDLQTPEERRYAAFRALYMPDHDQQINVSLVGDSYMVHEGKHRVAVAHDIGLEILPVWVTIAIFE